MFKKWEPQWPRKYKFDVFIVRGPKGIFGFTWDTSTDGVAEWNHTDGKVWWRKSGNDYRAKALKKYELIQRLPEQYARQLDGGPGLMKCVQHYCAQQRPRQRRKSETDTRARGRD